MDAKEIRAREEAATPGPWVACREGECRCKSVDCNWGPVATVTCGDWGDSDELIYGTVEESAAAANARFIAHARQDIPDLLAERNVLIQRLAIMENLASGILAAAIDEGAGEKVSEAITNLALYGVTLG